MESYEEKLADFRKVDDVRQKFGARIVELSHGIVREVSVCHTGPNNCAALWLHVENNLEAKLVRAMFEGDEDQRLDSEPAVDAVRSVPKTYFVTSKLKAA